jgi:nitroreductase
MNRQEWELRIVSSKAWIDRCTAAFVEQVKGTPLGDHLLTADFKNMFRNAPAVIFVAAKPSAYAGVNVGLLGENMMLAAWSMGIGSCCLGSVVPVMNSEAAKPYLERLQLPEEYKLMLAIAFGYPEPNSTQEPERDLTKAYYIE